MKYTEEEKKFVIENYGLLSYAEIARVLGRKTSNIKGLASRLEISRIAPGTSSFSRSVAARCNDEFFDVINSKSCYWAGFIAADGCIKARRGNIKPILVIALQGADYTHLEKFKRDINFEGPIIHTVNNNYEYKGVTTPKPVCSISITNSNICKNLEENFNITPRKSLTLEPPTQIEGKENVLSFIKGYIDGDGSISKLKKKRWYMGWSNTVTRDV